MTKLIDYETHIQVSSWDDVGGGGGVAYLRHNQSCAEGKLQQENLVEEKALAASFQDSAQTKDSLKYALQN